MYISGMNNELTIESIKDRIRVEIPNIDVKPYSDSIISIELESLLNHFGEPAKNAVIDELGLEKYGWHKVKGKIHRGDKYTDSSPF